VTTYTGILANDLLICDNKKV